MNGNWLKIASVFGLWLIAATSLGAGESNLWPLRVKKTDSPQGRPDQINSLGPIFSLTETDNQRILSIRPIWTSFRQEEPDLWRGHFIYPFVNVGDREETTFGNSLGLVKFRNEADEDSLYFQLFPIIFWNRTPREEESYFAFFPLGGDLKNRFWRDKITFYAWPLYVQTERGDETRTHVPYPFVQTLRGPKSRGFGLWPLFGQFQREDDYMHRWMLWPLHYHYKDDLDEPEPYVRFGVLPFYHRETAAGLKSETFVWPFFGYTHEDEPRVAYREQRYFWPLLVQGRGDEMYINRWLPFYAHKKTPEKERRWFLWPALKLETRQKPGILQERTSLFFFLYRDEKQHFSDTTARKTFIWPFSAYWHDGYDQRQLQLFDPLTVFFPHNKVVRENWTPLFALYRYDEREGHARHSALWDFIVWERDRTGFKSFYAGPLFEWVEGSHWQVLRGLVGRHRDDDGHHFNLFWQR